MAQNKYMEQRNLVISLSYHPHTDHFFVNYSDENGKIIISNKLSEGQAMGLSSALGIKIMQ
jgi:hypothetical protein